MHSHRQAARAADIHEEAVGRLNQALQLVLPLLGRSRRVQQVVGLRKRRKRNLGERRSARTSRQCRAAAGAQRVALHSRRRQTTETAGKTPVVAAAREKMGPMRTMMQSCGFVWWRTQHPQSEVGTVLASDSAKRKGSCGGMGHFCTMMGECSGVLIRQPSAWPAMLGCAMRECFLRWDRRDSCAVCLSCTARVKTLMHMRVA